MDEQGEWIREHGGEYGATTGRPRRCGWLDPLTVKHANLMSGLTDIVITKIDVLDGLDEIKVCVGYEIDGKNITIFLVIRQMLPKLNQSIKLSKVGRQISLR